jgi:hypothetical protein
MPWVYNDESDEHLQCVADWEPTPRDIQTHGMRWVEPVVEPERERVDAAEYVTKNGVPVWQWKDQAPPVDP